MPSPQRSRPSPSLVIACVALFVALGGIAYAVPKLDGDDIAKRSISGKKLEKNTLTGKEIDESTLRKVRALAENIGRIPVTKLSAGQTTPIEFGRGHPARRLNRLGNLIASCQAVGDQVAMQLFFRALVDGVGVGSLYFADQIGPSTGLVNLTGELMDGDEDAKGAFEGEPFADAFIVGPNLAQYKLQLWMAVNMFGAECAFGGQITEVDPDVF